MTDREREPDTQLPREESGDRVPGGRRSSRRFLLAGLAGLVLLCGLAYTNSLGNDFCFDDRPFIEKSEEIHDIANVPEMLGIFHGKQPAYRAVRQITYAVDLHLWGLDPFGFHLTNVILHAVVTVLVFFVVRALLGSPPTAWIAALLFALHPVHTESVTYVSGRKDVLCAVFSLAAILVFWRLRTRFHDLSLAARAGHGLAFALAWVLAWYSKEMAMAVFPIALALHLLAHLRETRRGAPTLVRPGDVVAVCRRNRVLLLAVALAVPFLVLGAFAFLRGTHATWHGGSPLHTFLTVPRIQMVYLLRMFFPLRLVGDYHYDSFRVTEQAFDPASFAAIAALVALCVALVAVTRKAFPVALGGAWYFLAMLPVSHIRPHHELLAERFLYVPSIGFCVALAGGITALLSRERWRRPAIAGLVLLLAAYGVRTHLRNRDWKDDLTFWRVTREQVPRNARAHVYYAYNLFYEGRVPEAVQAMHEGLAIMPDFPSGHYNLARMYERTGAYREAIEHYEAELARFHNESAYYNLGLLYGRLASQLPDRERARELFEKSEATLRRLLEHFRPSPDVLFTLGYVCEHQGKREEAVRWYRRCLAREPDNAKALEGLERLGARPGRTKRAG